jgi:hypothetical protein
MKRALWKLVFHVTILFVFVVLLVPMNVALDFLFTTRAPDIHGHYRSADRLFPGIIAIFICLWIADRIVSNAFRMAGISDERWSIFSSRRRSPARPSGVADPSPVPRT